MYCVIIIFVFAYLLCGLWKINEMEMEMAFVNSADFSTCEVFVDLRLPLETSIGTLSMVSMK